MIARVGGAKKRAPGSPMRLVPCALWRKHRARHYRVLLNSLRQYRSNVPTGTATSTRSNGPACPATTRRGQLQGRCGCEAHWPLEMRTGPAGREMEQRGLFHFASRPGEREYRYNSPLNLINESWTNAPFFFSRARI